MKKQPKPWLIFSGLFFQIAIVMFLLTRIGNYADSYFQTESNQFTLTLSLSSISFSDSDSDSLSDSDS